MKSSLTKFAAASIAIFTMVGAFYFGLTGGSVTASEMLEKVIQSNASYKGWLHITHVLTEEVSEDTFRGEGIVHMNTSDGTMIGEEFINGEQIIKYYSPPTKEYIEYSSLENQVNIYDLNSFPVEQLVAVYPLTIDNILTLYRQTTGKEPYRVSVRRDGDFERFDIFLFENEEQASRVPHAGIPVTTTIWAENETRLIRKFQYGERLMTFEYGEPIIESIYDLGVPQDSIVKDHRKTAEVETVLECLDQRIQNFGDYFAIITETPLDEDGIPDLDFCALSITARNGQKWLYNRYLVGIDMLHNQKPRNSAMETPDTWPSFDLDNVLELLKYALPSEYFIYDGRDFYSNTIRISKNRDTKEDIKSIKSFDLPFQFWLGKISNYGPGTKVELIKSTDGTNQVGLHIEYSTSISPSVKQYRQEYYWFDPERDDMPIKKITQNYSEDNQLIESGNYTVYLDYAQLSDGRWYTTCWQTFTGTEDTRQGMREYRLTLLIDYEIDEDWIKRPEDRINN